MANINNEKWRDIRRNEFEEMCAWQCTISEIAGFLRVSQNTIRKFCEETYHAQFQDVWKEYSKSGHVSVRRALWKKACAGNIGAIAFYGKNYMGMRDNPIDDSASIDAAMETLKELKNAALRHENEEFKKSEEKKNG